METTNYFKKEWDDASGEELTASWGASIFYFETDLQFNVLRHIQIFENGKVLKYDSEYIDDKFGGLAELHLNYRIMSTNNQSKEHIQTRLGRFLEKTFIVNDINLFDVKQINDGVLTVWPDWSPHGFINCMRTVEYLHDRNY